MNYSDNREFVSNYTESKLVFENADNSANFIPMEKDDAKKFIQSRQNSLGYYVYTFNKFWGSNSVHIRWVYTMTLKFSARLKSVEFMDKKRKHILHSATFVV